MIVATSEAQIADLEGLKATAVGNGVEDLEWLDGPTALRLEPALDCVAALANGCAPLLDCALEHLLGFLEARRQQSVYRPEPE